jgi:hypothetical protein
MDILALNVFGIVLDMNVIEWKLTPSIEIDYVVNVIKSVAITSRRRALPYDLVLTCILTKDFIERRFGVMSDMPVEMDIDRAVLGKEFSQEHNGFVEPLQVRVEPTSPCISIGLLLQY